MKDDKQKLNLKGKITGMEMVSEGHINEPPSLNLMAEKSLNFLENNPDPELDYECRFSILPSKIPWHSTSIKANEYGYDVIAIADTDLRMQHIWGHMRKMAGVKEASAVEKGVNRRSDSYVGEDGCCYANPAAFTGHEIGGVWMSPWGTSHQIIYYCDQYEATGDKSWLERSKKALDSLLRLSVEAAGMTDFPRSSAYLEGKWLNEGWSSEHSRNYTFIIEPLLRYYELSGDAEYLRRAILFAEAFISCMIDIREEVEISPVTGAFEKHVHLHTRCALWGMSHLAAITGDSRYLQWSRRVYDFVLSLSPDFGWYPEYVPRHANVSETCTVGDMMAVAYYLAQCGELDAYDEMERAWRNYLRCTQFFVTPDVERFIRLIHGDKPEETLQAAVEDLKRLEGGFMAQVTWNDLVMREEPEKLLYMMGCCPPSGMMALYYIWKAAAQERNGDIYVNMTLTADTPLAVLKSDYSSAGKLTVTAKKSGRWFFRPPEWAVYKNVRVTVNGDNIPIIWSGPQCRYAQADGIKAGDVIVLQYDLVKCIQLLSASALTDNTEYRFSWIGNSVVDITPKGKYIELFGPERGIPAV